MPVEPHRQVLRSDDETRSIAIRMLVNARDATRSGRELAATLSSSAVDAETFAIVARYVLGSGSWTDCRCHVVPRIWLRRGGSRRGPNAPWTGDYPIGGDRRE